MNEKSPQNETYWVAGTKSWNRRVFEEKIAHFPGTWHFASSPDELTLEHIQRLPPRYIFFLHWSHRVPDELLNRYECVCFHMTDVPYGRGGSPLQNLIIRGHRETKLTALRMVADFDAGPVYFKERLSLEGSAEEIYIRATHLSAHMIERIVQEHPEPTPQSGETTIFKRRTPRESEIPHVDSLQQLHDFIRMLDAEGYPNAYLDHAGFRFEFRRAVQYDGRIIADVVITQLANKNHDSVGDCGSP
jgi:methionyl-tRNA formyltransferase